MGKPFKYDPEQCSTTKNAMNIGSPLYLTSNMEYGSLKSDPDEIQDKWFPKSNKFTE